MLMLFVFFFNRRNSYGEIPYVENDCRSLSGKTNIVTNLVRRNSEICLGGMNESYLIFTDHVKVESFCLLSAPYTKRTQYSAILDRMLETKQLSFQKIFIHISLLSAAT